jgi:hypothetical protein
MAVTQNTYTGNGSTVLYSFTFPYLETTDIKVSLNGTVTTAYTLANATTIQFTTAPANGAAIRIYRQTDDSNLQSTFYPGSAIRSSDLNDNFTQNLYVTQEANNVSASATTTANSALAASASATSTSNTALSQSASALSTSASAVSTANAASATAVTSLSQSSAAVSTANTANANATAALNAAAEALAYTVVANVAAIPASPANGDAIRVINSTGIQSFTPLTGKPVGFVGDAGLTVEIYYSSSTTTWVWVRYYATDPESRYASSADLSQAQADILGLDTQKLDVTTAASTYQPISGMSSYLTTATAASTYLATSAIGTTVQSYDANTVKTNALPTFTVATRTTERTITAGAFDLSTGNLWTCGAITVPNPTNAVAGQTGAIRITAGPVVWSANFKFPGGTAPTIATFPAVIPYYVSGSSTILMGNAVAGIA